MSISEMNHPSCASLNFAIPVKPSTVAVSSLVSMLRQFRRQQPHDVSRPGLEQHLGRSNVVRTHVRRPTINR